MQTARRALELGPVSLLFIPQAASCLIRGLKRLVRAVSIDKVRIAQVIDIHLNNAIFHTPEGGFVTVSSEISGDRRGGEYNATTSHAQG